MNAVAPMQRLVEVAHAVGSTCRRRRIDSVRFTLPQRAVLTDNSRKCLWRDGNQMGKSYCVSSEAVFYARGEHPFKRVPRPPNEIMVISVSKEQMVPLHSKLWELLPKDEIDDKSSFDPGRGITGKPPRISYVRGPGKGSVIHFATYKQGANRIAGGTYDLVILDEPPPEALYGEVIPRLFQKRGRLLIGFTPTPNMPDVSYLREKVEAGDITEFNFHLKPEHVWVEGRPAPMQTHQEIEAYSRGLTRTERKMRTEGAWDPIVEGNVLDNFDREAHVAPVRFGDIAQVYGRDHFVVVSHDHGLVPNKEAITLDVYAGGLVDRDGKRVMKSPRAWAVDEEVLDGHATPELIVERTLMMLDRNGLTWSSVDVWVGDRAAHTRDAERWISNRQIETAWADKLRTQRRELPFRIETAFKPAGSVQSGLRMMNQLLCHRLAGGRPAYIIDPRCTATIESFAQHAGHPKCPHKDILDARRYGFQRVVRPGDWQRTIQPTIKTA